MQELDSDRAEEILRRVDRGTRVEEVRRCSSVNSGVWSVVCTSGRRVVVKTFAPEHGWQMTHEKDVYDLIAGRTAVPVPSVLLTDGTRSLLDRDFLVMTHVPGTEIGGLRGLTQEAKVDIYRRLGELLRELHAVEFGSFGFFTPEGVVGGATNEVFMMRRFAEQLRSFRDSGGDPALAERIERLVADSIWLAERRTAALCHNDLHEANAFAELEHGEWRMTGIIDVGGAIAADPLFDLARTHYWSTKGDALEKQALVEGYRPEPDWEVPLRLYQIFHALELRNHFARGGQADWLFRTERDIRDLLA